MTNQSTLRSFLACTVVALTALFNTTNAQNIWLNDTAKSISVETLKPSFDNQAFFGGVDFSFATSATYISGRIPLAKNPSKVIKFELPIVHGKVSSNFANVSDSETGIGNLLIGMEFRKRGLPSWTEVTVRLPTVDKTQQGIPTIVGSAADPNRQEAVFPDMIHIGFSWNYKKIGDDNVYTKLRIGPNIFIDNGDTLDDTEFFLDYSGQVGFAGEKVNFLVGLTGRYLISEDDVDFSDRTTHMFGMAATFNAGRVHPGVSLRLPIGDNLTFINNVIGLSVTYFMP